MEQVSLIMKTTSTSNESITTTIQNVNPEATNAQLFQLAQKLNWLTKNAFRGVTKVTKEELINV